MSAPDRAAFDRHWKKLRKAVRRYGPTHEKEHVWAEIAEGRAQFWPGKNSAIVTRLITYPTGFKELWWWLAAGDLNELKIMEPFVLGWARENGCKQAGAMWRPGFTQEMDGYRNVAVVAVKEL